MEKFCWEMGEKMAFVKPCPFLLLQRFGVSQNSIIFIMDSFNIRRKMCRGKKQIFVLWEVNCTKFTEKRRKEPHFQPEIEPFEPEIVANTKYPITEYQPKYFLVQSFSDARNKLM